MTLAEKIAAENDRSDAAFFALRGSLEFAHIPAKDLLEPDDLAELCRIVNKLRKISNLEDV